MADEDEADAIMLARKEASQKKREERKVLKEKERLEWEKAEGFNVNRDAGKGFEKGSEKDEQEKMNV